MPAFLFDPVFGVIAHIQRIWVISSEIERLKQLFEYASMVATLEEENTFLSVASKRNLAAFNGRYVGCFLMMMRQQETFAARRFLFWWSKEARKDLAKGYERLQKLRDDMDVVKAEVFEWITHPT